MDYTATTIMPAGVPARRRSPVVPVIAGVTGATLVLGVSGYLAATRLMAAPGGPEDVIPGNAFASFRLDMDPSLSQKAAYLKLRGLLPEQGGGDVKDLVCDAILSELDCSTQVKPWMGDRVAVAAWPGADADQPHAAAFVQVTDAGQASAAVSQAYPTAVVHEGYLIVDADAGHPSAAAVTAALEAHGPLADNSTYRSDLDALDLDGVAHLWVNLAGARDVLTANRMMVPSVTSGLGINGLDGQLGDLRGSLVGGVALKDDGLQVRLLGLDLGDLTQYPSSKPLQHLADLPAGTWAAVGVSGLAEGLTAAMQEADGVDWATIEDPLGVSLPQELRSLLGDEIVVGAAGISQSELSVQARMAGADRAVVQRAVDNVIGADSGGMLRVDQSGDDVLLGFGPQRAGRLGDDPRFARALPEIAKAQSAMFLDFGAMAKVVQEQDLTDLGYLGMTSAVDRDAARMEVTVDWIVE